MQAVTLETLSEHRCFDGVQGFYRHDSKVIGLPMRFGVYQPPQARERDVPVLFYLAGLTCTEETFAIKAGAQRAASKLGLMLVSCDTSPRQTGIPGEALACAFCATFEEQSTMNPEAANSADASKKRVI